MKNLRYRNILTILFSMLDVATIYSAYTYLPTTA